MLFGDKHRVGGVGDVDDGEGALAVGSHVGIIALDEDGFGAVEVVGRTSLFSNKDRIGGVADVDDGEGVATLIRHVGVVALDED